MRRKGELSSFLIDRDWPHQISLSTNQCRGGEYHRVRQFADTLSVCSRNHSFFHNDEWYDVFCFKLKEDAQKFKDKFGGEWFDPRRRGRGSRWHLLRDPITRKYQTQEEILNRSNDEA